jgi:predicted secreted protein
MTREQYDTNDFREHCRTILRPTIEQLKVYQEHGYTIVGGIGMLEVLLVILEKGYLWRSFMP